MTGATLMQHLRPPVLGNQGQGLGQHFIERLRAQTAADHAQAQRAAASGKARSRIGLRHKGAAQRIAHTFGFLQDTGEGAEHPVGHLGQHPIGQSGH